MVYMELEGFPAIRYVALLLEASRSSHAVSLLVSVLTQDSSTASGGHCKDIGAQALEGPPAKMSLVA